MAEQQNNQKVRPFWDLEWKGRVILLLCYLAALGLGIPLVFVSLVGTIMVIYVLYRIYRRTIQISGGEKFFLIVVALIAVGLWIWLAVSLLQ